MKNSLPLFLIAALLTGCSSPATAPKHPADPAVVYHNAQYNFTFTLPDSWRGYSVLTQEWDGQSYAPTTGTGMAAVQGPKLVLRSPQWTADQPTQDIPILVLTLHQWADAQEGRFSIYDVGVLFEVAHNSQYAFAIWSRFNTDDSVKGSKEADDIIQRNQAANPPPIYPDQRN